MFNINQIKAAIEALPDQDYVQLRHWFLENDQQKWDRQIEADSKAGKLDFLFREARHEKREGKLKS